MKHSPAGSGNVLRWQQVQKIVKGNLPDVKTGSLK
jgi:hypothetical protein